MPRAHSHCFVVVVCLALAACGELPPEFEEGDGSGAAGLTIEPRGAADSLDVASWNLEWFGSTSYGPTNEPRQLANVRDIIAGTDFDIWGLVEVASNSAFNALEAQLPGYEGFVANESFVTSGASFYSAAEQKPALLYKTGLCSLVSARLILTGNANDFAGRPPLEVQVDINLNGAPQRRVFIVLHMKAYSDSASWQRRSNAAAALKSYLDATYPTEKVWVIGDWNDDLDTSITSGHATPYQALLNDSSRYTFESKALTDAGIGTTVSGSNTIDHHLVTNDLHPDFIAGSIEAYRSLAQQVPSYGSSTSDHYPVLSRYHFGAAPAGQVMVNEILANEPGSNTSGEFIELVNVGSGALSLAGWEISDALAVRHTFAASAMLQPGKAVLVFGSAGGIPSGLANAVAASTGTLSLTNGGDTVTVRSAAGTLIDQFTYPSSLAGTDGVSMNRTTDGDANAAFALHTSLSTRNSSPGTRSDGSTF